MDVDECMENTEILTNSIELQKIVQKLEKLEKMINPNSKKSLILWEEDTGFKKLIEDIKQYALTCSTEEFPVELLDKLRTLSTDTQKQIEDGSIKVEELKNQAKKNVELSELLSAAYVAAMAGSSVEEYAEKFTEDEISPMKEYLDTIATSVPETEEYTKAEKYIKSKISNLENSVHITIDLERTTSKASALEYIKTEIAPAVERLQTEYDAKYVTEKLAAAMDEEIITALAIRKTLKEKLYDAIVRPITSLFKRKQKIK